MNVKQEISVPQTISIPYSLRIALIAVAKENGMRISHIIKSGIERELKSMARKTGKEP